MSESYDIIIIGSGPAGFTAAIYATRANLKTLMLAGEKWGGQLMLTTEVENYPGFPQGVLGPDLMRAMRSQAERFGLEIIEENVTRVDFSTPGAYKAYTSNKSYISRAVIVAVGAENLWLNVPGEQKLIGRGVSSCAPCDAVFFKNQNVAVVGGGDSALEEALVLTRFAQSVTVIHRRDELRASKIMQERAFTNPKINFIWNSEIMAILGEDRVTGVRLNSKFKIPSSKLSFKVQNEDKEIVPQELNLFYPEAKVLEQDDQGISWELPIEGLFVAIGHQPSTEIFKNQLKMDEKGYLKRIPVLTEAGLEKYHNATSIPGVFVAGDNHDYHYRQAVTAAAYGCMAAMDAERFLEENGEIVPGQVDLVKH